MKNFAIILIIFIVCCHWSYGNKNYFPAGFCIFDTTMFNKYDINNKKTGVWVEYSADFYIFTFYIDGKRNGVEMIFSSKNRMGYCLDYLLYYNDDTLNNWARFIDREYYFVVDSIRVNNSLIKKQKFWTNIDTLYESYIRRYKKGRLEEEGWLIYPENLEPDSEDVGLWKVYDENGNMRIEERGKNILPNYRR